MRNFFGFIIAVPIFIIIMIISGISGCVAENREIKSDKKRGKETISVRYYADFDFLEDGTPDYDNAKVIYTRINKKDDCLSVPQKDGYVFAGFYADPNFVEASWVADSEGEIVVTLTDKQDGLILYPKFIKIG